MWKVVTSSNLNPPLKLFFYSPILINNNLLLKIYYENIVKILWQYFSIRNFFIIFLPTISFSSTFPFIFSFSCFSPPHKCLAPFFLFSFSSHQEHSSISLLHIREKRERGEIGLSTSSRSSVAPASPSPLGQIDLFFLFFFFFFFFFIFACSDSTLF